MDQGDSKTFATLAEEVQYWKDTAKQLGNDKETVQKEFDDFVNDSQQLEKEYEVTIEQNEKTIRELRTCLNRSHNESDSFKKKIDNVDRENRNILNELNECKEENIKLKKYVRELEQKNDDLERAERTFAESVAGVEGSLNALLERNAMLESEVDETETLKVKFQRLVDEARDLKQELKLKDRSCPDNERAMLNGLSVTNNTTCGAPTLHPTSLHSSNGVDNNLLVDTNRLVSSQLSPASVVLNNSSSNTTVAVVATDHHHTQTTPLKRDPNLNIDSPFSPSTRVLALNIVGDLLRKVGNLEAKLNTSCNGYRDYGENARNRHRSRGRTSPSVQNFTK